MSQQVEETKSLPSELIDITIEEALSYIGKVGDLEFMREIQKMRFHVSSVFSLIFTVERFHGS